MSIILSVSISLKSMYIVCPRIFAIQKFSYIEMSVSKPFLPPPPHTQYFLHTSTYRREKKNNCLRVINFEIESSNLAFSEIAATVLNRAVNNECAVLHVFRHFTNG